MPYGWSEANTVTVCRFGPSYPGTEVSDYFESIGVAQNVMRRDILGCLKQLD